MALFFPRKSEYGLCGGVIEAGDVRGFPAFLRPTHRLWKYSDGVFHKACFERSPDREEVERLLERLAEILKNAPEDYNEYLRWYPEATKEFG